MRIRWYGSTIRARYVKVPIWAIKLTLKQIIRVRQGHSVAPDWRIHALCRQDQQRRITRKMRRILCHLASERSDCIESTAGT